MDSPFFETYFPNTPADQLAKWLWAGQTSSRIRKSFELIEQPVSAHLFFSSFTLGGSGSSDYGLKAVCNGSVYEPLSPRQFWHINRPIMFVQDVAAILKLGANTIELLGEERPPIHGQKPGSHGLMAVLMMVMGDGRTVCIQTDESWSADQPLEILGDACNATPGPAKVFPGLTVDGPGLPELYPATVPGTPEQRLAHDWNTPTRIVTTNNGGGVIAVQSACCDEQPTVDILPSSTDEKPWVIYDAGQEICGGILLSTLEGGSAKLYVHLAESVAESLAPAINSHSLTEFIVEMGPNSQVLLGEVGFRFARVELLSSDSAVRLGPVMFRSTYLPLEQRGNFVCNDQKLNDIWKTSVRTAHLCLQTGLWDGIKRDRLEWAGDLHVETEVIYTTFGDATVIKESLDHLRLAGVWPRNVQGIPGYTAYWAMAYELVLRFEDDREIITRNLEHIIAAAHWFVDQFGADGLWDPKGQERPLIDWAWLEHDDCVKGTHFQWIESLDCVGKVLASVGEIEVAAKCIAAAEAAREAARKAWLDPETGLFSKRQQVNAWATVCGALPESSYAAASEDLKETHKRWVSPFQNFYVLQALACLNQHQSALDIIRNYWGAMLDAGATTFWEVFDPRWVTSPAGIDEMPDPAGDTHKNLWTDAYGEYRISLCHGWAAGPATFLLEQILGAQPAAPGWKKLQVAPHPGDLTQANGSVPTPMGDVKLAWTVNAGVIDISVTCPAGMEVQVQIPEGLQKGDVTISQA